MCEPGASPDGYFFAINRATGAEIGTSRARIDIVGGKRTGYVATVGVVPEERGRGVARALVLHTLNYLAGLGVTSATLFVERENASARGLYDKMGWYPLYRTDHYWRAVSDPMQPKGNNVS
jgi:mycothiol synthase